jgi:hypothetical protein
MQQNPNTDHIKVSGPSPEEVDKWSPVKPYVPEDDLDHYYPNRIQAKIGPTVSEQADQLVGETESRLAHPTNIGQVVIKAETAGAIVSRQAQLQNREVPSPKA